MIKSMTGFGRAESQLNGRSIVVELKSVNHRYFEYSSRLPRACGFLDDKLKNYLQNAVSRGKVEVYVGITSETSADVEVQLNVPLAESYLRTLRGMAETYGLRDDVSVMQIARLPDVLTVQQQPADEETLTADVLSVVEMALEKFVAMRQTEGERLRADVLSRAATIREMVALAEERSPLTVKAHMEKVEARIRDLLGAIPLDEQRLLTEAAVFADKIAVAEETVRLRSHLDQLETMMESSEPIGRKLDFLVQEINREANTMGSKANDIELARIVVDIKAEIEKIREQIQNIE